MQFGQWLKRIPGVMAAAIAVALVSACVSAPVQEMSNARQVIVAATEAGAEDHAPDLLAEARAYLRSAEKNLKRHDYREARRDAVVARERAASALETADAARGGTLVPR